MRRAFSLIELLLAIFILAIGIVSVSAIFPAGIAQQQQTTDDQLGPVVAEQALGLLRSRLRPDDFGTFEEFGVLNLLEQSTGQGSYAYRPSPGDWGWIRPGVIKAPQADVLLPQEEQPGSIDIFSHFAQRAGNANAELCEFPEGIAPGSSGAPPIFGAPYTTRRPPEALPGAPPSTDRPIIAPMVIVSQRERWWPSPASGAPVTVAPQYAWECMFRRHSGRVQVAIFVFRIAGVGGAAKEWRASRPGQDATYDPAIANGGTSLRLPPVPFRRVMASAGSSVTSSTSADLSAEQVSRGWTQPPEVNLPMTLQGPFTTGLVGGGTATVPGGLGQGLLPSDFPTGSLPQVQHQWQMPGQWLVDNNGNVHRVAIGRRNATDPPQIRLSAPVPRVPAAQVNVDYEAVASTARGVRTLHYVPAVIDGNGTQLVPVYVTVRDL